MPSSKRLLFPYNASLSLQVFVQNYTLFAERRGYPLTHFSGFSVQIFTVPLLTARLVLENDLLDILLETLRDAVRPAIGQIGRLEVRNLSYELLLSFATRMCYKPLQRCYTVTEMRYHRPEKARRFEHTRNFFQKERFDIRFAATPKN